TPCREDFVMNLGPKYRELTRALGVNAGALEAFGVRATDTANEAKGGIIAAVGLPAWRAAQRANAGPARGSALLSAMRAAGRADEGLDNDGDEPCAMCDHDRDEHPDDGPCTHEGCDCDEYTSEDEARAADEPPPSSRPKRSIPNRTKGPPAPPPKPDE